VVVELEEINLAKSLWHELCVHFIWTWIILRHELANRQICEVTSNADGRPRQRWKDIPVITRLEKDVLFGVR
jgi:hypothetical protein